MTTEQLDSSRQPTVSVVMPAYNNAQFIGEAIDSVLAQTCPPLEIVIVDDGSTDNTVEIIRQYGDKVRLLQQPNQGSAVARNLGIQQAKGQYIAFLDADDVWWHGKLAYQLQALAQHEYQYKMAYTRFITWDADESGVFPAAAEELALMEQNPKLSDAAIVTGSPYAELLLDCIVWTSTVIIAKTELEKIGGFDESLRRGQDYDLWIRLSRQTPMLGLNTPTALYRNNPSGITKTVRDTNSGVVIISKAVRQWGETGPDGRRPPPGSVSAYLARLSFSHGVAHLKYGKSQIAVEAFRQSLQYNAANPKARVFLLLATLKKLIQPSA